MISASAYYIEDKFSYGRPTYFYYEETLERLKADIKEKLASGEIKKNAYVRIMRDEVEDILEDIDTSKSGEFYLQVDKCSELMEAYGWDYESVPVVTGHDPQLKGFMQHIWPQFVEFLKKEAGEVA